MSATTAERIRLAARRQRQVAQLYASGPRPIFEALIAVADGETLDAVLASYTRIPAHIYRQVGADQLDLIGPHLYVIEGRRP